MTAESGIGQFTAVAVGNTPKALKPRKLGRTIFAGVVIAVHVVVLAMFAFPVLRGGDDVPVDDGPPVAMLDMDITAAHPEAAAIPERPAEPLISAPPELEPQPDAAAHDSRPPVLKPGSAGNPTRHAMRAGLEIAKSARAVLVVGVTAKGRADTVEIAVSSGDAKLDAVAAEYARSLEWTPALVEGRKAPMSIRLPVVFGATG